MSGLTWDRLHARAFNAAAHPSLSHATEPRVLTAAHALAAASPALVGVYPAADGGAGEPYPMGYVPPGGARLGLPAGVYAAAVPGEEFVVRVGGRGGMDAICEHAGSADVLVNVSVGGREVGDISVLQRGMGDVADDVFYGFKVSESVGGTGEARYSRFCFEKAEVLSEEELAAQQRAAAAAEAAANGGGGSGDGGDAKDVKVAPKDVGLLEVRFATAVRIPPDIGAAAAGWAPVPGGDGDGGGGGAGVRVGKAVPGVAGVSEMAASKHGVSVGVGRGGEARRSRNWMSEGVCYGEDQPDMAVTIRLRERWWLEAKGVLPQADGRWVKDIALAGEMDVRGGRGGGPGPARKKAKKEKSVADVVVDLEGGRQDSGEDDDDD